MFLLILSLIKMAIIMRLAYKSYTNTITSQDMMVTAILYSVLTLTMINILFGTIK